MDDQTLTANPEDVEAVSRLRRLPPGPFRSLGGFLDYAEWPDRDRFLELDRSLRARRQLIAMRHNAPEQTHLASAA
jgi:hypothetical protein